MLVVFVLGVLVAVLAAAATRGVLSGRSTGVLVGCVAVVGIGLIVAIRLSRRGRSAGRSAAAEAAETHGFEHDADADPLLHRQFAPLPGIPRSGKSKRVLVGNILDRSLTIFQHTYVVNTGQAVVPVHHTAYVCAAPAWPEVIIIRRGLFSRIAWKLGRRGGLRLEHEPFNRGRRVRCTDEDFAIMLLGPEMQRFLAERPDIAWRIGDGRLAMVYSGALRFDRIGASIDRLHRFWALIPPELEEAFAGAPAAPYSSPSHE